MRLFITFLPILILIIILLINLFAFNDTMSGPNQIGLLISTTIGIVIAYNRGYPIKTLCLGMIKSIKSSINAITILLIIGGLASTWILSGVVPAMIYYGIELINPQFFLFTTCVICAIVSISTGSSWTTAATIGIALISIGELLSISRGLVAGAIISGAYFGDKMSPLSETTNLAPSVAGSELINHIKYMTYTTIPTIIITLILFFLIGLKSHNNDITMDEINIFLDVIQSKFYIGPELFILPLIMFLLIYNRFSAITTLSIGVISGALIALIFQPELINEIKTINNTNTFTTIINTIFIGTNIPTENMLLF